MINLIESKELRSIMSAKVGLLAVGAMGVVWIF